MDENEMVVAGIDTHKDVHVLCLLDGSGRKIFTSSFAANRQGYRSLACAIGDPKQCKIVGVEGTASYGAGLARHLMSLGYQVAEVLRPKRDKRRIGTNKNDPEDAERAARDALAGNGLSTPKSQDGWVEAIRFLQISRKTAVQTSTTAINKVKALMATAPEDIKSRYSTMGRDAMMRSLRRKRSGTTELERLIYASFRSLAILWEESNEQVGALEKEMKNLLELNAPALLDIYGCGPVAAASLAIAAGDNPERMRSEAAFASLCGVCPIEASSGKVVRYRLNRGGDRQANSALYHIAIIRMRYDEKTMDYMDKRRYEGKSTKEALRCLKRYIAKEIFRALLNPYCSSAKRGSELKAMRIALELTQTKVGVALGVPSARISEIESGARRLPELEYLYQEWLLAENEKAPMPVLDKL